MVRQKIEHIIKQAAENTGYSIYEHSFYLQGENSRIVVRIDSLKGIGHEDCDRYSMELSRLLDEGEILPNYSLEISSPGLNRALRSIEDFQRFIGSPVKLVYKTDGPNQFLRGEMIELKDDSILLETEKGQIEISLDSIVKANLDF